MSFLLVNLIQFWSSPVDLGFSWIKLSWLKLTLKTFKEARSGQLIKWKCVGSAKTGLRSLRRVTPRWKGQKLTNIEPLSSGQRLVDKAAIRFLCRQPGQLPAPLARLKKPWSKFYTWWSPLASRRRPPTIFTIFSLRLIHRLCYGSICGGLWRLEIENRDITHVKRLLAPQPSPNDRRIGGDHVLNYSGTKSKWSLFSAFECLIN